MIERPFWTGRIEDGWKKAPIVWLSGVRKVGKTTLLQSLGADRVHYIDCDLPAQAARAADPESFYRDCERPIVAFDEIRRLPDPGEVLKTGVHLFPHLKIVAISSSTVAGNGKFKDTLTGRKRLVHLTPVLWDEVSAFNATPLQRLSHGGIPEALTADTKPEGFYPEWMDAFFARDIEPVFAFRDPRKFNTLFEYVLKESGNQFGITAFVSSLGLSRPVVADYLRALEMTRTVTAVNPFYGGGLSGIVKMPRLYGFDTGFVNFFRGQEDRENLWKHIVLEYLEAHELESQIKYWCLADGRELDFVIPRSKDEVDVMECRVNQEQFDPANLKLFRALYPRGRNYLICPLPVPGSQEMIAGMEVYVCDPGGWRARTEETRAT